jgi:putative tricarboxylic transport membrane protein
MDLGNFLAAFTLMNIALALFGVAAGTIIGSIPGLTATMAVAVLVPITFSMQPASALILLGAIYTGAIYGGAYAAILLNTPGTPSAIATTFDGYPMAKRGDGDLAVALACFASVFGGMVGALALLFMAPPLSEVALAFGPGEYFWLSIFGLSLIASLSNGNLMKGLAGGALGLILSTVGVAEISADIRLTFGSQTMISGFGVVGALIGLYCIPVLIDLVAVPDRHLKVEDDVKSVRIGEAARIAMNSKINLIRSSVIGTLVGILPGAGGSVAGLVAYSEAKRNATPDQKFGEGEADGIIATESANNATVGGGFIPTLVLGIPGTPPDAVILGALLVQGVRTGPTLFQQGGGSIAYTFIYGLIIATLLMLPVGLIIGRYAYKSIVLIPKAVLVPTVGFMTIIGTFAIHNSITDVIIMICLGIFGWVVGRFGFSASPIVLGLILGPIAEQGFVQSWIIGDATENLLGMFFGRPISQAIVAFTIMSLLYPLFAARRQRKADEKSHEQSS